MTNYNSIFQLALSKIQDSALAQWPEQDLTNEMYLWLQSAISNLPQLNSELSDRDEFDLLDTETKGFDADLSDTVKEILALSMVRAWLRPMINSTTLTLSRYSKKEGYSQAEHLKSLMSLDKSINDELRKLLRDKTYTNNSYLG